MGGPAVPPVPGPGEYTPGDTKTSSAKFGFATAPREAKPSGAPRPSPGDYNVEGNLGDFGPKFSMKPRNQPPNSSKTPGPGTYSHEPTRAGASDRFGHRSAARFHYPDNGLPAPGHYETKIEARGGSSFPRGARDAGSPKHVTPAPGHYAHHSQFAA
eukprot:NODE_4621_length_656_cov_194.470882.p2 GENE.NODE_4621_length_656_cov_194.470882~~NODE_4621_length_656_cov_194.470882.p2  ORF type:complete len:157 (-),score=2.94 NODE_4621_length_656_cov_194.470882:168-638(-)